MKGRRFCIKIILCYLNIVSCQYIFLFMMNMDARLMLENVTYRSIISENVQIQNNNNKLFTELCI